VKINKPPGYLNRGFKGRTIRKFIGGGGGGGGGEKKKYPQREKKGKKKKMQPKYQKTAAFLSSAPRGFAARSRVLARLVVSLAQIGELARRLVYGK